MRKPDSEGRNAPSASKFPSTKATENVTSEINRLFNWQPMLYLAKLSRWELFLKMFLPLQEEFIDIAIPRLYPDCVNPGSAGRRGLKWQVRFQSDG